jgi:lysozyme family protein
MKKIVLIIGILLGIHLSGGEQPLPLSAPTKIEITKAQFLPAYEKIRNHEGNYSNHVSDKGGETYGGVTRKYNGEWYGWRHIDRAKKENGPLSRNYKIEEVELWVLDYYLDIWVKEHFYEIKDQDIANYIFDFRVNVIGSIRTVQRVLIELGKTEVSVTGIMDEITIHSINELNPDILLINLRDRRIKLYQHIVSKNKTQQIFLKGWLERANRICDEDES